MPLFDTHIIVDWSARSKPSPAKPTKDAIFWAVARDGTVEDVTYVRTRAEARVQLVALLQAERAAGRRVLVGFDFPFGYPRGTAEALTGEPHAYALWDWISARIEDGADNANNRYAVAEEINRAFEGVGPMWGRPAAWDHPDLPTTAKARHGDHPPERRLADSLAKGAKTVWQLAYAGSVGSQVLLGVPLLKHLRESLNAEIWPFDTGLTTPQADIVIAEIYPSLLQAEAHAARNPNEPLDAAQVRVNTEAFARLDAEDELAGLFVSVGLKCKLPAGGAERAAHGGGQRVSQAELGWENRINSGNLDFIIQEEAWILGLGHEDALRKTLQTKRRSSEAYQRKSALYEAHL